MIETPLLYEKEQDDMPEWKKCWKKLLMKDGSIIEIQEYRKKYNDIPPLGRYIFYNLLSKDDKERYDSLSKDCKRLVDSSIALKHMKHTYNSDENSITVTLEQVLDSPREELLTFVNNVFNIKAIYIEKEEQGQVWSYYFKQEIAPSGARKQIEGWKKHSNGLDYVFVNGNFMELRSQSKMFSIDGEEYPAYCNVEGEQKENAYEPTLYGWHEFTIKEKPWGRNYICERGGKLLYFVLGCNNTGEYRDQSNAIVWNIIEYRQNDRNYRLEISEDTEPAQIKKVLKKMIQSKDDSLIRMMDKENCAEIVIYKIGSEQHFIHNKYFIAVKNHNGIRYAVSWDKEYSLSFVQEFELQIPEMCLFKYNDYLCDFVEDIVCSDHGFKWMSWVYFFEDSLKIEIPELDFLDAETVILPEKSWKKAQVTCTAFEYTVNCRKKSFSEEKLKAMTSKKMYNLAVKKLETGGLGELSICAVCEGENEKNLVLYGDGKSFSIGIIDTMEEVALCYDNGSGDNDVTEFAGYSFPNTMVTDNVQLLKDIIKNFCEKCQPLDAVQWVV